MARLIKTSARRRVTREERRLAVAALPETPVTCHGQGACTRARGGYHSSVVRATAQSPRTALSGRDAP